ncbi:CCR4-NOT transcription complex subunit 9-like [Panicum virgatum]|uniref:CCR4-NOT transcription complex subunit 9-like n=1 Tax=Panicum virgatum TaxID=38727 RepID=UPI0019D5577F|nr:CCR4-NOT transcription complex subunit 9-like [Panicum virgatum]
MLPGLTELELAHAEAELGFALPPDPRVVLAAGLPSGPGWAHPRGPPIVNSVMGMKRRMFKDLAPMLWYSFAQIPLYLYPFLNTTSKAKSFEYLRLASLNVIDALVKVDDTETVNFLVTSQVIPLCLPIMETDSELPKLVATSIARKIMLDASGLQYICATADRFFEAAMALAAMVSALAEQPSGRLLKHVVRYYLRLTDNPRARDALQICLPQALKDGTFDHCLQDDPATRCCLQQLLDNLGAPVGGGAPRPGGGGGAEKMEFMLVGSCSLQRARGTGKWTIDMMGPTWQ